MIVYTFLNFAYNNGYHSSLSLSPFQALYSRPCRTPLSWDHLKGRVLLGPEILQDMEQYVVHFREHLVTSQDMQKKYENDHRLDHQFSVGDRVFFLTVCSWKSHIHYGKGSKWEKHFIRLSKILERIGHVTY